MTSRYTAVLQHLRSGRMTAELPVSKAKATSILNAPGSLSVSMPLATISEAVAASDVEERRNAIFLLRDDTVVGEGIIETSKADVQANALELSAVGWHHYLRNLYLKQDVDFLGDDQTAIAKWLVDYASAKSGALTFSTANVTDTGRTRVRSYFGWERHSIGELIDSLAAVIDGFHFRYRSARSGEGFVTEFLTSYPATGRATNFVLELGGNVELLSQTGDGSVMANSVEAIGSGQGADAPIVEAIDTNVLADSPLWEAVDTFSDVSETSTLREKAERRLGLGLAPVRIPQLRIGADVEPKIGSYLVGDQVRVRGDFGLLSVNDLFVITQIDLTVEPTGEYVDLTVAPADRFRV